MNTVYLKIPEVLGTEVEETDNTKYSFIRCHIPTWDKRGKADNTY